MSKIQFLVVSGDLNNISQTFSKILKDSFYELFFQYFFSANSANLKFTALTICREIKAFVFVTSLWRHKLVFCQKFIFCLIFTIYRNTFQNCHDYGSLKPSFIKVFMEKDPVILNELILPSFNCTEMVYFFWGHFPKIYFL